MYNEQEVKCMATNKMRYMISVDPEMFRQIEDFRFEHRYPTRSEATSELIRLGLEQVKRESVKATMEKKVEMREGDKRGG